MSELDIADIRQDIIKLAAAIRHINGYNSRLPVVESLIKSILAPSPLAVAAEESLALLTASAPRLGKVLSISAEWDAAWNFVFQFRCQNGYQVVDGFDLRSDKPGWLALKEALDIFGIDGAETNLPGYVIREAKPGMVNRLIVYPRTTEPTNETLEANRNGE